jgi:hypothetical protein
MTGDATVRAWIDRLGITGVVGAALVIAAAAMAAGINRERAAQVAALRAEVVAARGAPQGSRGTSGPMTPLEHLRSFHARFPPVEAATQSLNQIREAAVGNGITLVSGEYRMELRPEDRLRRYRVTLPIQGSYAQIRTFVDRVLVDVPWAALDEVEMRREGTAGQPIQARLRFTVYLRAGS